MLGYLLKRLGYYVVLLVVALGLSYLLASAALSPRAYFESRQPKPTEAAITHQLQELGVDDHKPIIERFGHWVDDAAHGNLGQTIDNTPVNKEFGRRIGASLRLLVVGAVAGTVIGILIGVRGAVKQYKAFDRVSTVGSFVVMSIPPLVIAVLLTVAATWFNQTTGSDLKFTGEKTPELSNAGFFSVLVDRAGHMLLPTIAIALGSIASYSRYQRNTMLDVLGSDYLRTARAKGLSRRRALLKHGLRTALIPMATFFAYGFITLMTGAIVTENIFGWSGMGSWFMDSINRNDVNSTVAFSMFTAVVVLLAGFVADVLHAALDPRVRHA